RISPNDIYAQADAVDLLVLFNWADYGRFKSEIVPGDGAFVLHEATDAVPEGWEVGRLRLVPVPFTQIAKDAGAPASKNVVTLGILGTLFGLPVGSLRKAVAKKFGKKKEGVAETNLNAFDAGAAFAASLAEQTAGMKLAYTPGKPKLLMSGNEAAAVGAVHAGCRFFAGYPITPSSEVLHYLSEWMPKLGGSVVQTEDELSAFGAVLGGSFAGVKSMTATSGPGLSLMAEMIGLSAMAEIPSVIVNVQRGGPSTGNPTKSEQSDLSHAIYASHGDAPRVVLAPSDVEDCFHTTVDAFNIAEEFQLPVIVLSDQLIGQRRETLSAETMDHPVVDRVQPPADAEAYDRYKDTPSGVSPMAVVGMKNGVYQTNGLEHDEAGRPNSNYIVHEKMNEKRYRKLKAVAEKYHFVRRYGPEKADVGIVCWGSSKGAVTDAGLKANANGQKVAALVPQILYPFPAAEFEKFAASVKQLLFIELNFNAQFYMFVRTQVDLPKGVQVYKRSGGRHLAVSEVENEIRKAYKAIPQEVLA
ncbi:MAG TPA: 2-oxoacid:acceptor oxidoreductase subunit alpha, partial [Thermoanaerobaculia bacterium]|nr:2-oxoacid:acceptor oxidoreductase subunit alpha [Thermoanaerobaculia bacterium]